MGYEYSEVQSEESGSSNPSFEKARFLDGEGGRPVRQSRLRRALSRTNIAIGAPWLLVVILCALLSRKDSLSTHGSDTLGLEHYSPAADAIEYEEVLFARGFGDGTEDQSPYQGWPNDEKDRLWDELYSDGFSMQVDTAAHDKFINKTMQFPVHGYEDTYVVGLDVFHQLHCLNRIRKAFYPKRYNSSLLNEDGTVSWMMWMHIDHCVESIRQSLTCSSDVTANGFDWRDDIKYMMPRINTVHKCRNFERIKEWAFERFVPLNNLQSHVEDGELVDYTGKYANPEAAENLEQHPEFKYTVDDM